MIGQSITHYNNEKGIDSFLEKLESCGLAEEKNSPTFLHSSGGKKWREKRREQ
jgi:hypothetical protein